MEGSLGSLGISLPTLIAQIINFIILFVLLYLVAYKPIMRMLDERSRKVKESMEQTEYIKEQAALAEKETAKRIEAASKEGQKAIGRALKTGEEIRQKAQQEARPEAEALIAKVQLALEQCQTYLLSPVGRVLIKVIAGNTGTLHPEPDPRGIDVVYPAATTTVDTAFHIILILFKLRRVNHQSASFKSIAYRDS